MYWYILTETDTAYVVWANGKKEAISQVQKNWKKKPNPYYEEDPMAICVCRLATEEEIKYYVK